MKLGSVWKYYFTENLLKAIIRTPSQFNLPPTTVRLTLNQLCKLFPQQPDVDIDALRLAGSRAEKVTPNNANQQLIFHIHGGAFFLGGLDTHRAFMTDIAVQTKTPVIHIDYPLAPEHRYPEAIEAIYDSYQSLLTQGIQPQNIILSGDSCGANLALALCLRLKKLGETLPSGLILLSPFLDLTLTSASLRYNQKLDALLSIETLQAGIQNYLKGKIPTDDPSVSPLFDDLSGLPPTLVQVGSKEILLDDAKRFKEKAEKAGVKVNFKLYTGMWHIFQLFNAWFPEAKQSLVDIAEFTAKLRSTP